MAWIILVSDTPCATPSKNAGKSNEMNIQWTPKGFFGGGFFSIRGLFQQTLQKMAKHQIWLFCSSQRGTSKKKHQFFSNINEHLEWEFIRNNFSLLLQQHFIRSLKFNSVQQYHLEWTTYPHIYPLEVKETTIKKIVPWNCWWSKSLLKQGRLYGKKNIQKIVDNLDFQGILNVSSRWSI